MRNLKEIALDLSVTLVVRNALEYKKKVYVYDAKEEKTVFALRNIIEISNTLAWDRLENGDWEINGRNDKVDMNLRTSKFMLQLVNTIVFNDRELPEDDLTIGVIQMYLRKDIEKREMLDLRNELFEEKYLRKPKVV